MLGCIVSKVGRGAASQTLAIVEKIRRNAGEAGRGRRATGAGSHTSFTEIGKLIAVVQGGAGNKTSIIEQKVTIGAAETG